MRRLFLKRGQFNSTGVCFLGSDFIGNGHWALSRQFASNRGRFTTIKDAEIFVKKESETHVIEMSLEDLINRETLNEPLTDCTITDICIGMGVLINKQDGTAAIAAPYANLLKTITGANDSLKANDKILVAYDGDENPGLVISFFEMNDLLTSNRNRESVRALATQMFSKPESD